MLHGYAMNRANFVPLAQRLAAAQLGPIVGFEYWSLGRVSTAARRLGEFVTHVREQTGASQVDLVGHSMGGLVSTAYVGGEQKPPVDAFIAASCTAIPRGVGLATYRALARGFDRLPGRGARIAEWVLDRTLPDETRADFGAGGYAYDAQDVALRSLSVLDLLAALRRIDVPTWFINGQYDQLRLNERLFVSLVPGSELIVVPRTSHLVTAMRPRVFNALLDLALATMDAQASAVTSSSR